jgi:hypothetical protein
MAGMKKAARSKRAKKIVPTKASLASVLDGLAPEQRRRDGRKLVQIMRRASGEPATVWGNAIVGFGTYRYATKAGRAHEAPLIAFSPRGTRFSLYHMDLEAPGGLLERLGRYQTGKRCLYIARLEDVDTDVLAQLCAHSCSRMRATHSVGA